MIPAGPVAKLLAIVFAWPLTVLLAVSAYHFYIDEIRQHDVPPPNRERIQHATHHAIAQHALARFKDLHQGERRAIRAALGRAVGTPESAFEFPAKAGDVMCLGENHDEYTRRFLADQYFRRYGADALFVEADPQTLAKIMRRTAGGKERVPLLGADIAAVIRAARSANPAVRIVGIEETAEQRARRRQSGTGSRDRSIAGNFRRAYRAGEKTVILYGALQCSSRDGWLLSHLRSDGGDGAPVSAVRVLGEHQDGPLEAFVFFLDEIGIRPGSFSLSHQRPLPPEVRQWFLLFWDQTVSRFDRLVVFRNRPTNRSD